MKNVLITGASRGIGAECVRIFAEKGFNILLNYNSSEKEALNLKKEMNIKFPNVVIELYKCNVKNLLECEKMVQYALSIFGKIDVLVANAAIAQQKLFIDTDEEDFNSVMDINLKGVYNSIKSVLPSMLSNQNGNIVAVSSIWGISGGSGEAIYSASKAGIIGLCKSLSKELGPSNIKVNCVAPGAIETQMNNNLTEKEKKQFCESVSLGRFGTTKEVASAVYFLATSTYITGQTLVVDGGTIWYTTSAKLFDIRQ